MTSTPWEGYSSSIQLRPYQQRAMASFQAAVEQPRKRFFYLVAPPGAGKTLLGLLMSEILELPCLSLSPNAAIQAQWLARLQQHWVCLDSALEAFEPHPRCSDRPAKEPQALVSLTYQRIAVRDREGAVHPNVLALYQALREAGVQCVVLDECHHLSSEWGRAVEALCQALEVPFVVGLTATPVTQEEGPLARLLGEPDHEISLPSVIRSGDLAPFQDLCHLVAPSPDEEDDIQGSLGRFERLFSTLCGSEDDRFGLNSWLDMLELSPVSLKGEPYPDLLAMFKGEPELVTAWCRHRAGELREPPAILPYLPELYEPATLTDRLLLAAHYTSRYMLRELPGSSLGDEALADPPRGPVPSKQKRAEAGARARPKADRGRAFRVMPGVKLPPEVEQCLARLASRFYRRTGQPLVITSGTRSAEAQAEAMYAKLIRRRNLFRLYSRTALLREVVRAYRRARRKRLSHRAARAALARVIRSQVLRGEYLSAHLRNGAVDIRSYDMSRRQRRLLRQLARSDADILLLKQERHPPHFHLEVAVDAPPLIAPK